MIFTPTQLKDFLIGIQIVASIERVQNEKQYTDIVDDSQHM